MGLAETVAGAVSQAFDAVDNLKKSITYHAVAVGVYDPVTDTNTEVVTDYTLEVIESTIKTTEQDWTPVVRDSRKLVIEAADLPVEPKEQDRVTLDGLNWEIIKINGVPGDSVWMVFIRQP